MKRATVLFFLLVSAVTTRAQSYGVVSDLPNNGAPIFRDYVNPYADVAMFPVIAVGKFSNATQIIDDIVTLDASGNVSCLTNNGDGTFSQPIVTSAVPLSALPITASRVITLPNSTSTLLLAGGAGLNGNAGTSTLFILTFTQCAPTTGGPGFNQGPLLYISNDATISGNPFVLLTFVCGETALSFGSSPYNFSGTYCATQFWPGPFVFSSITYQDATVIVGKFGATGPATVAFTDALGGQTNQIAVEGEYFLGFIQTPDGIVTASSTNNQLFLDQINANRTITALGAYTLAGNPVGMVDTGEGSLVIAAGDQVTLFSYAGTTGRPLWNVANTLTASGQIGAIDTGALVANESDIVAQIGSNAEVFSSRSFTEVQTPPPPTPTTYTLTVQTSGNGTVAQTPAAGTSFASGTVITLTETPGSGSTFSAWSGGCSGTSPTCTVTLTSNTTVLATFAATPVPSLAVAPPSATVSAGNSASYAVTSQNFSTTPTLTATCEIPKGSCSISGGQLVATTTATTTSATPFDWYPWAPTLLAILLLASLYLAPPKRRTLAVGLACCLVLTACGSGSRPPAPPTPVTVLGTPAGSYTITITATQGTTVVNSSAILQVQ